MGDKESDYEKYTMRKNTSECFMGSKVTFIRRKRESECFNPNDDDYLHSHGKVESCYCSREDYVCDVGYKLNNTDNTCQPVD